MTRQSPSAKVPSDSGESGLVRPRRREPGKPKIEGYELEEVLGRGAMGTVYRARQTSVDREVALKILHPELVTRPRIVHRMQREARMTARLAHPNLVSALDMGTFEGRLWYAMEFVDGPTLSLRLREEGRLSEREALRLFIPLCEALEHLSEHGIVHRDVKPSNILLDRKGVARLADLGLAFADEDPEITKHGGTLGTPQYISPEQAIDPTKADLRSDLWSFGATLFHSVCGRPPFAGESTAEVLSAVLYERVPDPRELEPSLSKGFGLVLRKCLAREPEARYQSPRELLLDLERVRERRQPRVRRSTLDPVASQLDRRPWYLSAAALALVAGGLLVGVYGPWRQERAQEKREQVAVERASPLLENLERRLAEATIPPGALLSEHAALEVDLPAAIRPRWNTLRSEILDAMTVRAESLARNMEVELTSALASGDYVGSWALLQETAGERLRTELGLSRAELAQALPRSVDWIDELGARVEEAEDEALARLRRALGDHETELAREIADQLERQQWAGALQLLEFDRDALLASTGFSDHAFRPERFDAALVELRTWTKIQRDRVSDQWRELDRELRGLVVERADRLREELEAEGPAFSAAAELLRFFEQELSRRRLVREGMPKTLPTTARDALGRELVTLRGLEDGRLESDARRAMRATEMSAAAAWRARDVERVEELWTGVRELLRSPGGLEGTAWRAELELECSGRLLEVQLVSELLQHAAERIVARSGSRIDLRLRGVRYSERFLSAGPDPLRLGFRLEGLEESVRMQDLSARELARIAGLDDPQQLPERNRIALAALLQQDGEYRTSLTLLRAERSAESSELERLALDLAVRATDALQEEDAAATQAAPLAADVAAALDPVRLESDPEAALRELERLLSEHVEDAVVRSSRAQLNAALARARAAVEALAAGVATLRPSAVEELRGGRQRLSFDFTRADPGAWEGEGWLFDGLGWSHTGQVVTVADFSKESGLVLPLGPVLDQSGSLVARFDLEQPLDAGRTRLLVVELDGVFVAFVGERLPGALGEPRLLVETAGLHALLERAQKVNEGTVIPRLRPGQRHVIEIEVGPRRGRVDVRLDGAALMTRKQVRTPPTGHRSMVIRAWDPMRLYGVSLELQR